MNVDQRTIEMKTAYLADQTRGTVDLRFHQGSWCVMVSLGNTMVCVPGSISHDIHESLECAIERWESRSESKPFLR